MKQITKKQLKETFNNLAKKSNRNFKYKRCIKNDKNTLLFEVYNFETIVFSTFYNFKLLDYNKKTQVSTFWCSHKDIELTIKYNL
jgi:hypothetical protein